MKTKIALLIISFLFLTSCSYIVSEKDINDYLEEKTSYTQNISMESEEEKEEESSAPIIEEPTPEPTIENDEIEEPINICDKEILFMNIPWGTSFTEVNDMHGELGLWGLNGDVFKTFSVYDIIIGEYEGIDFEYSDINIIGNCSNSELEVAGYTTTDVSLYFAYDIVNGSLPKTENESSLYGGQYVFSTENLDGMYSDLKEKLISLYGEPNKTTYKTDYLDLSYKYTWWFGKNDTVLVLKSQNASNDTTDLFNDEITISYAWMKGDELLKDASNLLKKETLKKEESNYGSNNTAGL